MNKFVVDNPWSALRRFTDARIGLGRTGISLPTDKLLEFQLSHAKARDAVHLPLNIPEFLDDFKKLPLELELFSRNHAKGLFQEGIEPILLHSQAIDRDTYLKRPDLGRRLNQSSRETLQHTQIDTTPDIAIAIVDGLSSVAIKKNAINFIQMLARELVHDEQEWILAPFTLVEQGRVAVGDEIGELLNTKVILVLIGERPGLSSPDSLGIYLTYNPKIGLNDANRNCISNIRADGLLYQEAAQKCLYLLKESKRLQLSGVALKDRAEHIDNLIQKDEKNFLLN